MFVSVAVGTAMLVTLCGVHDSGESRQCCSSSGRSQAVCTVRSCYGSGWVRDYDTAVPANNTTQHTFLHDSFHYHYH